MRVFVAGATGAVGSPLVRGLLDAGHEVTALTRSEERAAKLRARGVRTAVADVFEEERVRAEVERAGAEVVIHQLTALPEALDVRSADTYAATNRLRREGTRILVEASAAAGARRLIAQSIAFAYAPVGERVKSEDAPLVAEAPTPFAQAVQAVAELERRVNEAERLEGVVLRYGFFYGPGTHYAADGSQARAVSRGRLPIVGQGGGVFSFVHVDDAAGATVAATERGAPGIYNVVDDEPAPMREWLPVYAAAIGARRPRRVPVWLARLLGGAENVKFATELRGASNAKAKRELGWRPTYASWRRGFPEALA